MERDSHRELCWVSEEDTGVGTHKGELLSQVRKRPGKDGNIGGDKGVFSIEIRDP